jgi:Zn-dependent membrane protease YugP
MILSLYAQAKIKSTFAKYSKIQNKRGTTGKTVAEQILNNAGLYEIRVDYIKGSLTDHYHPKEKVLRLSDPVYNSTSIAAIGVAALECGHAIQHNKGYTFLRLRNAIVPTVQFGSNLAMPLVDLGFLLGSFGAYSFGNHLVQIGIILFSFVVVFQLITLPVELNASNRAIQLLLADGYLDESEIIPAKKVLNAAALTYIAAAAVAISNLIRLIVLYGRRK